MDLQPAICPDHVHLAAGLSLGKCQGLHNQRLISVHASILLPRQDWTATTTGSLQACALSCCTPCSRVAVGLCQDRGQGVFTQHSSYMYWVFLAEPVQGQLPGKSELVVHGQPQQVCHRCSPLPAPCSARQSTQCFYTCLCQICSMCSFRLSSGIQAAIPSLHNRHPAPTNRIYLLEIAKCNLLLDRKPACCMHCRTTRHHSLEE